MATKTLTLLFLLAIGLAVGLMIGFAQSAIGSVLFPLLNQLISGPVAFALTVLIFAGVIWANWHTWRARKESE